jgi:hypothetical protein
VELESISARLIAGISITNDIVLRIHRNTVATDIIGKNGTG